MERNVAWAPWTGVGLEHLRLVQNNEGSLADGVVVGAEEEGTPFRVRYGIRCDARWRVRELEVLSLSGEGKEVRLLADGEGHWTTATGRYLTFPRWLRRRGHLRDAVHQHSAIRRLMLNKGE